MQREHTMLKRTPKAEVDREWCGLLMRAELARNYPNFDRFPSKRFQFLDNILIASLYVNLVSFLDQELETIISEMKIRLPSPKLYHRIEALADMLTDAQKLHSIRDRRNAMSHEVVQDVTWQELIEAQTIVGKELTNLGLISNTPEYRFFAEFGRYDASTDPSVKMESENVIGVKLKGSELLAFSAKWHHRIMRDLPRSRPET